MAREVIFRDWCDPCLYGDDVREPAVLKTPPLSLGGGKPREMDLCERHRKEVYDPLADLLAAYGSEVKATAEVQPARGPEGSRITCRVPGCAPRGKGVPARAKNRASFAAHVRQQHGLTLGDYEAAYGPAEAAAPPGEGDAPLPLAEPVSGPSVTLEPVARSGPGNRGPSVNPDNPDHPHYVCGIDGCTTAYPPEEYSRPAQALGVHRKAKHGVAGPKSSQPGAVG